MNRKEMHKRMRLMIMTFSPLILGFLLLVAMNGVIPNIRFSLFSFIVGLTGVIIVIRKEIPMALGSIKGKSAVFQGAVITILFWLFALYSAIYGLK
ncbi:hypothetical protein [Candidatus Villigracilis affinis]|uniref:hypothetical protein n=1 Tax=Candidatus Villigracilis affinis TaxID=3140682 RepID=UPI002A1BDFA6|nr:hypothetical protein [Anaerolineales bacterium]